MASFAAKNVVVRPSAKPFTQRRVFTMSAQVSTAQLSQDELKKQAAWKAVDYVKSGMVVGLGTGSTAAFAVDRIGQLLKEGQLKDIVGVPTSVRTYEQAKSLGIPLATLDEQPKIDVAIDGADEVDPNLDVVKGRGGALLREKMVEMASDKFVCIVDDTKLVEGLGGSKLAMPVEITQFCHKCTQQRVAALPEVAGCEAKLRMDGNKPYVTDNHNFIVDLYFQLYDRKQTKFISAHNTPLVCLTLSLDGKRLATASDKGTLVRIWNTADGQLLQELRRGSEPAHIHSIAFSKHCDWLAVSSDKGTVHIFALGANVVTGSDESDPAKVDPAPASAAVDASGQGRQNPTSMISSWVKGYVPIPLPKYFTSEWSFAQYKLTDEDTGRSLVGFSSTDPHSLVIITQSGRYHKVSFDPLKGGPCVQQAFGCYIVEGEDGR